MFPGDTGVVLRSVFPGCRGQIPRYDSAQDETTTFLFSEFLSPDPL